MCPLGTLICLSLLTIKIPRAVFPLIQSEILQVGFTVLPLRRDSLTRKSVSGIVMGGIKSGPIGWQLVLNILKLPIEALKFSKCLTLYFK